MRTITIRRLSGFLHEVEYPHLTTLFTINRNTSRGYYVVRIKSIVLFRAETLLDAIYTLDETVRNLNQDEIIQLTNGKA